MTTFDKNCQNFDLSSFYSEWIRQLTCICEKVGGRDSQGRKCAVGELEFQFSTLLTLILAFLKGFADF